MADELLDATLEELGDDELLAAMLDDATAWLEDESVWLEDSCVALEITVVDDKLDCATLLEEPFVPMQALSARVAVPSIAVRKWQLSR